MIESGFEERLCEALNVEKRQHLSDALGVNYQTLSNWLNGRAEFPIKELAKIAKLSNYSLNWILTGKGQRRVAEPPPPSIIDLDALKEVIRSVVREEREEDQTDSVGPIEPAEMILAPVVARIEPGRRPDERTVSDEELAEIQRRLEVRKRKTG